jgi:hypothetical protein
MAVRYENLTAKPNEIEDYEESGMGWKPIDSIDGLEGTPADTAIKVFTPDGFIRLLVEQIKVETPRMELRRQLEIKNGIDEDSY